MCALLLRASEVASRISRVYTADRPDTPKHAQQLLEKLKSLDGEFRELHYEVIDLIDEGGEDTIEAEQVILDKHDDDVAALTVHLESLLVATASVPDIRKSLTRRLSRLQVDLRRIDDLTEEASVEHCLNAVPRGSG